MASTWAVAKKQGETKKADASQFTCDVCGYEAVTRKQKKIHMTQVHQAEHVYCMFCRVIPVRIYTRPDTLRYHVVGRASHKVAPPHGDVARNMVEMGVCYMYAMHPEIWPHHKGVTQGPVYDKVLKIQQEWLHWVMQNEAISPEDLEHTLLAFLDLTCMNTELVVREGDGQSSRESSPQTEKDQTNKGNNESSNTLKDDTHKGKDVQTETQDISKVRRNLLFDIESHEKEEVKEAKLSNTDDFKTEKELNKKGESSQKKSKNKSTVVDVYEKYNEMIQHGKNEQKKLENKEETVKYKVKERPEQDYFAEDVDFADPIVYGGLEVKVEIDDSARGFKNSTELKSGKAIIREAKSARKPELAPQIDKDGKMAEESGKKRCVNSKRPKSRQKDMDENVTLKSYEGTASEQNVRKHKRRKTNEKKKENDNANEGKSRKKMSTKSMISTMSKQEESGRKIKRRQMSGAKKMEQCDRKKKKSEKTPGDVYADRLGRYLKQLEESECKKGIATDDTVDNKVKKKSGKCDLPKKGRKGSKQKEQVSGNLNKDKMAKKKFLSESYVDKSQCRVDNLVFIPNKKREGKGVKRRFITADDCDEQKMKKRKRREEKRLKAGRGFIEESKD